MLITVILDQPGLPRFTRDHHGSLGLGTVNQGVALRKHPGRPRCLWVFAGGPGSGQKHPDSAPVITECLERGYIKCKTAHAFHHATLTLTVSIFQIMFRRTLQPRNTSWTCLAGTSDVCTCTMGRPESDQQAYRSF